MHGLNAAFALMNALHAARGGSEDTTPPPPPPKLFHTLHHLLIKMNVSRVHEAV